MNWRSRWATIRKKPQPNNNYYNVVELVSNQGSIETTHPTPVGWGAAVLSPTDISLYIPGHIHKAGCPSSQSKFDVNAR